MRLKARIILATLIMSFSSGVAKADDSFSFSRNDHQAHIAASYGVALTSTLLLEKKGLSRWESVLYASLGTLTLGLAKELIMDDEASGGDMVANFIGTGLSAGVVFAFEF